jgi:thiamine-phosphate pyrophosphorylase
MIMTHPRVSPTVFAEVCVETGIRVLQIREKDLTDRELWNIVKTVREVLRGTSVKLIINDRTDIALACSADGLHLGQDDLPPEIACRLKPEGMLLGLSTHTIPQYRAAQLYRPDYCGFGPLFPTPTKMHPDPVTGLEPLRTIMREATVPVIAIGGIFPDNLPAVLRSGARDIALVRHFAECTDRRELTCRIEDVQSIINTITHEEIHE